MLNSKKRYAHNVLLPQTMADAHNASEPMNYLFNLNKLTDFKALKLPSMENFKSKKFHSGYKNVWP